MKPVTIVKKAISFKSKNTSVCPVCRNEFNREELHSGGGRLIAGKLTEELRRLYEESKKFGKVYPLAYQITTCPKCLFSAFDKDFKTLSENEKKILRDTVDNRRAAMTKLFGPLDFTCERNLVLGAATYVLACDCYHFRGAEVAPTPKKAITAIRAAWLFSDIFEEVPNRPYDKVRDFYYMKAVYWYRDTLQIMQTNEEPIDAVASMLGPDSDQNWGFEGVMYLNGFLSMKFVDQLAHERMDKIKLLMNSKKYLSKLYGSGKGSKSKPSVIIDMAKDIYDALNKKVESLGHDPNNYNFS